MSKKRVYISGPITGVDNYEENFKKMATSLTGLGYEVINPAAFNDALPNTLSYEEYLKFDLSLLNMCDTICLLKGWEKSLGANREYGYALAKGYKVMYE